VITARHLAKAVQSFGHLLAEAQREVVDALVHLYAGKNPLARQVRGKRHAVARLLAEGLVEQDHPGDVLLGPGRGEQQPAVGTAVLLGALDVDRLEALLAGAARFVGGEHAFAARDHGRGGLR